MNEAHWHLILNHLPIIFPVVGVIVMITGLISKSEAVKRTSYLVFIIGALTAIAAMQTGEGAEDIVEKISGVSESYIETHEEAAEIFSILSYVLGGFSLFGLWANFKEKSYSHIFSLVILVFAIIVLFFAQQTATSGGEVRHSEIRSTNNVPSVDNYQIEKNDD